MTVLVLAGSGRYADPWHDFDATSSALAEIATGPGRAVTIDHDVERALTDLAAVDLLIVNVGNPVDGGPTPGPDARRSLHEFATRGGAILGMHTASTTFRDWLSWPRVLGGRWVRGRTMHPPYGPARLRCVEGDHPVTAPGADLDLVDERYSYLELQPDNVILYDHEHDGRRHPLIWARQRARGRTVYDALGHSVESYENEGHRQLLHKMISWLLDTRSSGPAADRAGDRAPVAGASGSTHGR